MPWNINTEMVAKIVAVRVVTVSIGPFCTGFRCEELGAVGIFGKWTIGEGKWTNGDGKSPIRVGKSTIEVGKLSQCCPKAA